MDNHSKELAAYVFISVFVIKELIGLLKLLTRKKESVNNNQLSQLIEEKFETIDGKFDTLNVELTRVRTNYHKLNNIVQSMATTVDLLVNGKIKNEN